MIEVIFSGFLFWFIIAMNFVSARFGYETFSDLNAEAKLQKINSDPKKFKTEFTFILIEHVGLIGLAVMLFFAFNSYSLILAVVWTVSRTLEALIQIYYKKSYWGLLNLAKKYSRASDPEKDALFASSRSILKTKNTVFVFAQMLFSVGTLAYSVLFVTSGVVPDLIGWFGIVSSVIYGIGNGINFAKPNFKALWNLGGLLILIFEFILGGWLLFFTFI